MAALMQGAQGQKLFSAGFGRTGDSHLEALSAEAI